MRHLFIALLILPTLLMSEIIESDRLDKVLEYNCPEAIVFLDVDNTLIESETHLGSSQWSDHYAAQFKGSQKTYEEIDALVDEVWSLVQPLIRVRAVDPKAVDVLATLKQLGTPAVGLTARRQNEMEYTHKQLDSVGICFKPSESVLKQANHPILLSKGIIFCSPLNKKGEGLKLFLDKFNLTPSRIIFIDDKLSHVKEVGELVEQLGIEYVGIRFSGADARVASYSAEVSKIQWEHLPTILSDEEALLILKGKQYAEIP